MEERKTNKKMSSAMFKYPVDTWFSFEHDVFVHQWMKKKKNKRKIPNNPSDDLIITLPDTGIKYQPIEVFHNFDDLIKLAIPTIVDDSMFQRLILSITEMITKYQHLKPSCDEHLNFSCHPLRVIKKDEIEQDPDKLILRFYQYIFLCLFPVNPMYARLRMLKIDGRSGYFKKTYADNFNDTRRQCLGIIGGFHPDSGLAQLLMHINAIVGFRYRLMDQLWSGADMRIPPKFVQTQNDVAMDQIALNGISQNEQEFQEMRTTLLQLIRGGHASQLRLLGHTRTKVEDPKRGTYRPRIFSRDQDAFSPEASMIRVLLRAITLVRRDYVVQPADDVEEEEAEERKEDGVVTGTDHQVSILFKCIAFLCDFFIAAHNITRVYCRQNKFTKSQQKEGGYIMSPQEIEYTGILFGIRLSSCRSLSTVLFDILRKSPTNEIFCTLLRTETAQDSQPDFEEEEKDYHGINPDPHSIFSPDPSIENYIRTLFLDGIGNPEFQFLIRGTNKQKKGLEYCESLVTKKIQKNLALQDNQMKEALLFQNKFAFDTFCMFAGMASLIRRGFTIEKTKEQESAKQTIEYTRNLAYRMLLYGATTHASSTSTIPRLAQQNKIQDRDVQTVTTLARSFSFLRNVTELKYVALAIRLFGKLGMKDLIPFIGMHRIHHLLLIMIADPDDDHDSWWIQTQESPMHQNIDRRDPATALALCLLRLIKVAAAEAGEKVDQYLLRDGLIIFPFMVFWAHVQGYVNTGGGQTRAVAFRGGPFEGLYHVLMTRPLQSNDSEREAEADPNMITPSKQDYAHDFINGLAGLVLGQSAGNDGQKCKPTATSKMTDRANTGIDDSLQFSVHNAIKHANQGYQIMLNKQHNFNKRRKMS